MGKNAPFFVCASSVHRMTVNVTVRMGQQWKRLFLGMIRLPFLFARIQSLNIAKHPFAYYSEELNNKPALLSKQ